MTTSRTDVERFLQQALHAGRSEAAQQQDEYDEDLEATFEDRCRLDPLTRNVSLPELRRVWLQVKGKEALPLVDAGDVARNVLRFGCSARDDDSFTVWVVRGDSITARVWLSDTTPLDEAQRTIAREAGGLRSGDNVLALHFHICATDCFALAEHFLSGVRVL